MITYKGDYPNRTSRKYSSYCLENSNSGVTVGSNLISVTLPFDVTTVMNHIIIKKASIKVLFKPAGALTNAYLINSENMFLSVPQSQPQNFPSIKNSFPSANGGVIDTSYGSALIPINGAQEIEYVCTAQGFTAIALIFILNAPFVVTDRYNVIANLEFE